MGQTNNGYGRDGDLDSEISEIIAQCAQNIPEEDTPADDIGEMARRYGIDVGAAGMPYVSGGTPYGAYGGAPAQPSQYDENGGRIVYDADMQKAGQAQGYAHGYQQGYPQGYAPGYPPQAGAIPSAAERRKKAEAVQPEGARVVYDAATSGKTAYEAPFDNIGNTKTAPKVSDGKEKSRADRKKEEMLPGQLTKGQRICKVFLPWNGDPMKEKVRKIVMDISFFVLLICAVYFVNYLVELWDAVELKQNMGDVVSQGAELNGSEDEWAAIREKYPDVDFPEGMNIRYAESYATNQDFVGWISIDNTNIDIPIVQGDDNSFYLKHDFRKRDTKYGNAFMDYRNNVDTLDHNTIIHGHHMKDNMLFAQLEKYMTLDGYKEAPVITFNTLYHDYQWKVYAVFVTNDDRADDNGYMFNYIVPNFHSLDSYASYIEALDVRKLYDTGVDLNTSDHMLTLSTCSYEFDGARLVVVARMVREGESAEVDTSKATLNENPRYPQKWYDVNGKENPYADAFNWEPNV